MLSFSKHNKEPLKFTKNVLQIWDIFVLANIFGKKNICKKCDYFCQLFLCSLGVRELISENDSVYSFDLIGRSISGRQRIDKSHVSISQFNCTSTSK